MRTVCLTLGMTALTLTLACAAEPATATAAATAATLAIPVSVFGVDGARLTVDGKPADVVDNAVQLPRGIAATVAWEKGNALVSMTVIAVDGTCSNAAPSWIATPPADGGVGFAGAKMLSLARDKAMMRARVATMRAAAGIRNGSVSGNMSGGAAKETVITIARDAADQPPYTPPPSRTPMVDSSDAGGEPGSPWVRCWVRLGPAKVEVLEATPAPPPGPTTAP